MARKNNIDQKNPNNFTEINKLIAKFLEDVAKDFSDYSDDLQNTEPITYRFNLEISPRPKQEQAQKPITTSQQPINYLVDTINKENELVIIAEMPGAEKKDIKITALHNEIMIETGLRTDLNRRIKLSSTVDPKSGTARLRNGILELTFNKAPASNKSSIFRVK